MFNDIYNLNFANQDLQSIDDFYNFDINQFQSFPPSSSIIFIPDIKNKGKINSRVNNINISKKIKEKSDNNFEFKEYNKHKIDGINKGENISINEQKKNGAVDILEQLKAEYLNKKDISEKKLGKKRKNCNSYEKHTKFSDDNIQRKCITIIINNSLEFINKRIEKIYNGNIGNGMNCKKLLNVQIRPNFLTIDFIKILLNKTLGEIFSDNIRIKYTNYLSNHNSLMIKKLLNEKDQDKRMHLEKLFGITFLQCVKKFVGIYNSEELDEFITFNEYKDKLKQEPEYLEALKDYLINFEENIRRKKPKKKKKS